MQMRPQQMVNNLPPTSLVMTSGYYFLLNIYVPENIIFIAFRSLEIFNFSFIVVINYNNTMAKNMYLLF